MLLYACNVLNYDTHKCTLHLYTRENSLEIHDYVRKYIAIRFLYLLLFFSTITPRTSHNSMGKIKIIYCNRLLTTCCNFLALQAVKFDTIKNRKNGVSKIWFFDHHWLILFLKFQHTFDHIYYNNFCLFCNIIYTHCFEFLCNKTCGFFRYS